MSRLTKCYYSGFHKNKPTRCVMTLDEVRTFSVDFNGALESETVSSVEWDHHESVEVEIADAALSAGIATVEGTAEAEGTARISCIATLSSGRKLKQWFHVKVVDEADVR